MKQKEANDTLRKICPVCGKPSAGGRRPGSLTAFLFGASDCACLRPGDGKKQSLPLQKDESDFCPKCGLKIVADDRVGSLTGFLFQSTRCKCLRDQAFADGQMSAKFWKLKQAGAGTTFISAATDEDRPRKSKVGSIDLAPGATIGGAYKIIELLGRGGMGEVYLARHETLGKKCALKVIPPEQVTEMGWQRFQLEARAVAKLEHKNLVRVTDLGIHDGCLPFYAMDFVEGKNLAELLAQYGPMPLAIVLDIFMQVCDGVDCAHYNGILHRDLKPANIMVHEVKSGQRLAKILDFGLAKLTGDDRSKQSLTAVGDVFGSPFYMSPEQCNGDRLDRRSDIYSLGCTMFECLTGQPPFTGHLAAAVIFSQLEADPPSLESIAGADKFPASMGIVMAKLLRKNPVERYQTLSELRGDLEKVARGEDVQPFYVSRSRQIKDIDTVSGPTTELTGANTSGERNAYILPVLAAVVTCTLLIGLVTVWLFQMRPVAKVTNASKPSRPLPTEIAPASAKETKPYSSIVYEKNGKILRVFEFPDDVAIGDLQILTSDSIATKELVARGIVATHYNDHVSFLPRPMIWKYPNYLKRFRSGDIFGINLSHAVSDDLKGTPEVSLAKPLELCSAIPGVRALNINLPYRDLSAAELAAREIYFSAGSGSRGRRYGYQRIFQVIDAF